jgi:hypothetical protein
MNCQRENEKRTPKEAKKRQEKNYNTRKYKVESNRGQHQPKAKKEVWKNRPGLIRSQRERKIQKMSEPLVRVVLGHTEVLLPLVANDFTAGEASNGDDHGRCDK